MSKTMTNGPETTHAGLPDPERWTSRPSGERAEDRFGAALRLAAESTGRPRSVPLPPVVPRWLHSSTPRPRRPFAVIVLSVTFLGGAVWATHGRWMSDRRDEKLLKAGETPASADERDNKETLTLSSPAVAAPAAPRSEVMASVATHPSPAREKPARARKNTVVAHGDEATLVWSALRDARRNDAAGALRALDEHRRKFPKGTLLIEADVVRAEALLGLGRRTEAIHVLDRLPRATAALARQRLKLTE